MLSIFGILPRVVQVIWPPFVTGFPAIDAAMYGPDNRIWFAPDF
ncbi:hypothetical protein B4096_0907 [Heyndrickxia coagulans]|nr:hypothetical protein B4096_0907 [Heyndrickxia coagulans]